MRISGAFPVRWAPEPGQDGTGVTIRTTATKYAGNTSGTAHPTSGWSDSIPVLAQGAYLWTWVHVEYSDGTQTDSYSVSRIGIDGKGINSSVIKYCQKSNTNTAPENFAESDWGTFPSQLTDGYWLYSRTHIVYSDGASSDSYSVSQIGVGSYYAGCQEYYAVSNNNATPPSGYPTDKGFVDGVATYANGESVVISGVWSTSRPSASAQNPYIWNFEISYDSRGNKYVTQPICIGNFSKGIVSIVESYAISSSGIPGDDGYPSDITSSDWQDEQHASVPTDQKRYQWNRTVVTYTDNTTDTHYHVSSVRGLDGVGTTYIDLDNENDSMLYDGAGNLVGGSAGYLVSNVSLYSNGEKITTGLPTFSIKEKSASVSASVSDQVLTITGISSDTGYVIVCCTYNNVEYVAKMTIKRLVGVDKYELQLNHNAVSYNATQGVLSNSDISVEVYRTAQNGSRTKVAVPNSYNLTAYLYPNGASTNRRTISFSSGTGTASITSAEAAAWTNFAIVLFKGSDEVDRETIPITKVNDGGVGPGAVILDLDNENDSMLYDGAGNLKSGNVTSQCKLLVGGVDKTDEVSAWNLGNKVGGVIGTISDAGLITITGITETSGSAIAYATYGGVQYSAKITIKKLVGVDKYEIVCSPNAFTYNTTKGTGRTKSLELKVYRTGQNGVRTLVEKLGDYNLTLKYYFESSAGTNESQIYDGTSSGYYNNGVTRSLSVYYYLSYRFELYDSNNVLLDSETIPISKNSDGEGLDAVIVDLDNENDSLLYDGADNVISDPVVSTGSLYKGPTKVEEGIVWSIESVEGCTLMNSGAATSTTYARSNYPTAAWITSNGLVTVNGLTASQGKVVIRATYGGNTYDATLTLKKLRGIDKYDLVISPAALTYNTSSQLVNGKSSETVVVQIWRTAQNGERSVVDDYNEGNQYGLSINYPSGLDDVTEQSYGLTFSVDGTYANSNNNIPIVLKKGTMVHDSESIPIAKTSNGSGEPGPASKAIYKLSFETPATPTGSSPQTDTSQGAGVLAWSDDKKTQDEVKILYNGNWYKDVDGYMRAPAIGTYQNIVETLNFVTTSANQKIYLRVKCTIGSGSYVRIGNVDAIAPQTNYQRSVSGSNQDTGDIEITISTAGSHFICLYYYRSGYDDTYVKFISGKMGVWQSNAKTFNSEGTITEWSTPFRVSGDTDDAEIVQQTNENILKQTAFISTRMDKWTIHNGSTCNGKEGRNAFLASNSSSSSKDILEQIIYDPNSSSNDLNAGTWYTLSFWVKSLYSTSLNYSVYVYLYPKCANSEQGTYTAIDVNAGRINDGVLSNTSPTDNYASFKVTSGWIRHTLVFKTRTTLQSMKQAVLFRLPSGTGSILICMPKIEEGTKVTDYCANATDLADYASSLTGFPNDRSIWVESPNPSYEWNDDHRDYVAYDIDGVFKKYFVKQKGMTVPDGTAPTAGGNSYWEEGSTINTLLTNTIIGENASIGGFLATNQVLKSANNKLILNGVLGIIQMFHDDGYSWRVLEDGRQVLGIYEDDNNMGQNIQFDPSSKEIRIYNENGVCVTYINGQTISSIDSIFGSSSGSLTLDSTNKEGSDSISNSDDLDNNCTTTDSVAISTFNTSSACRLTVNGSISATGSMSAVTLGPGLSPMIDFFDENGNPCIINSADIQVRVLTYSDANRSTLISQKYLASVNSKRSTSGYGTKTLNIQNISIDLPAGYHTLEVYYYCIVYAGQTVIRSASVQWSITSASYVSDIYLSRVFANGVAYGSSLNNFFAALNLSSKMFLKGITLNSSGKKNGFELSSDGLSLLHADQRISPIVTLGWGKVTCSHSGSVYTDTLSSFANAVRGGGNPTLSRISAGVHRIAYPSDWTSLGLQSERIIVNATALYNTTNENNTCSVKTIGTTYCEVVIGDDISPNDDKNFYFEIKYMLP